MKNSHGYSSEPRRAWEYKLKLGSKNQFFPPVKPLELQIDLETWQDLFSWWLEVIYEIKWDSKFFGTITLTGFSWELMLIVSDVIVLLMDQVSYTKGYLKMKHF